VKRIYIVPVEQQQENGAYSNTTCFFTHSFTGHTNKTLKKLNIGTLEA
jgi:hypothetical protein